MEEKFKKIYVEILSNMQAKLSKYVIELKKMIENRKQWINKKKSLMFIY